MSLRSDLASVLLADTAAVRSKLDAISQTYGFALSDETASQSPEPYFDALDFTLSSRDKELIARVQQLDNAPLGITLTGPAYQDTPILYSNKTFRSWVQYELAELCGNNPRLLQGPKTSDEPRADFREALSIWEPVTVEIHNYRNDGTVFTNRVSLTPIPDESGTIANWVAIQAPID
ncbi:PAS domain-containing protein [Natronocalculus amylovorans]|uniref:PAS domain-containing protein n=1 Tax=Natronocalculus amylovorans TaxID=2917812 RepID=A0AAE3FZB6_9EURY|nr:PAS domain-containing protein [Natronocalculus amylovorans]MCL9818198.1 PAS domain-containing protein [Natronocalculus amylovorans]NUE03742.1 PAS domain-containing protein [Halorubraceae archaeon YAN]